MVVDALRVGNCRDLGFVGWVEDWRADLRLRWVIHGFHRGPQSGYHRHVSSPRHLERSMRISRTTLTCLLRAVAYGTLPTEQAFRRAKNVCLLHLSQPLQPSPQRISSGSGLANNRARLSVRPCLPYGQKNYKQQGRFAPRALLRLVATTDPSDSLSPSARFPGVPGYAAYLAPFISDRDEEGLSSCSAHPCHHAVDNHPAGVFQRLSLVALVHVAFTVDVAGSASRAKSFEATSRSLALRPGDSPPSLRRCCR